MAKPRVFISSTYYDLRGIRADLERFVKEIGYEAVLFEKGHVAYGKENALEDYCYREISSCDILVAIIGGKYGTQAKDNKSSITQKEIRSAIEQSKQIYIFVDKAVLQEYRTYLVNKDNEGFTPVTVNDKRVFVFLEEVYALPAGNPIEGFELAEDITKFLKEQWAGLFQRLLNLHGRGNEVNTIEGLRQTAITLNSLVSYLTSEKGKGDAAIDNILFSNHPLFAELRELANIPYRVYFENISELKELLGARGLNFDELSEVDYEYQWDHPKLDFGIAVKKDLFDANGKLINVKAGEWKKDNLRRYILSVQDDDEIPF